MNISLTSNNIFKLLEIENKNIYKILCDLENNYIFKGDVTCLRHALSKKNLVIQHQKCRHCFLLSILNGENILSNKTKVLTGKYKNNIILNYSCKRDKYSIEKTDRASQLIDIFNQNIKKFNTMELMNVSNLDCYQISNKLLHLAILNIILINIMKNKNYPNIPSFIFFYVCNYKINFFRFKYEIENFRDLYTVPFYVENEIKDIRLEKNIIHKIIIQTVIFFKFFSYYHLLHNQPSIEFMSFESSYICYNFDGRMVESNLKMHLHISEYSSLSLYNQDNIKRFIRKNSSVNPILDLPYEDMENDINGSFYYADNNIDIEYVSDFGRKRIFFYKIGNRYQDFINARRFYGVPVGGQSFDIICILLSLMLERPFYESFVNNYKLVIIWKGLWRLQDYDLLMKDISMNQNCKKNNFETVYNIIKKYYIRFDALEYCYQMFFKTW